MRRRVAPACAAAAAALVAAVVAIAAAAAAPAASHPHGAGLRHERGTMVAPRNYKNGRCMSGASHSYPSHSGDLDLYYQVELSVGRPQRPLLVAVFFASSGGALYIDESDTSHALETQSLTVSDAMSATYDYIHSCGRAALVEVRSTAMLERDHGIRHPHGVDGVMVVSPDSRSWKFWGSLSMSGGHMSLRAGGVGDGDGEPDTLGDDGRATLRCERGAGGYSAAAAAAGSSMPTRTPMCTVERGSVGAMTVSLVNWRLAPGSPSAAPSEEEESARMDAVAPAEPAYFNATHPEDMYPDTETFDVKVAFDPTSCFVYMPRWMFERLVRCGGTHKYHNLYEDDGSGAGPAAVDSHTVFDKLGDQARWPEIRVRLGPADGDAGDGFSLYPSDYIFYANIGDMVFERFLSVRVGTLNDTVVFGAHATRRFHMTYGLNSNTMVLERHHSQEFYTNTELLLVSVLCVIVLRWSLVDMQAHKHVGTVVYYETMAIPLVAVSLAMPGTLETLGAAGGGLLPFVVGSMVACIFVYMLSSFWCLDTSDFSVHFSRIYSYKLLVYTALWVLLARRQTDGLSNTLVSVVALFAVSDFVNIHMLTTLQMWMAWFPETSWPDRMATRLLVPPGASLPPTPAGRAPGDETAVPARAVGGGGGLYGPTWAGTSQRLGVEGSEWERAVLVLFAVAVSPAITVAYFALTYGPLIYPAARLFFWKFSEGEVHIMMALYFMVSTGMGLTISKLLMTRYFETVGRPGGQREPAL